MPEQFDVRRVVPVRGRVAALAAGTTVLAVSLALVGVSASNAAPEDSGSHRPGHEHAVHDEHEHPKQPHTAFAPGGIDGEVLRQRIIREAGDDPDARVRTSADALRVTEQEAPDTTKGNDHAPDAERVPRPERRHDRQLRIDGELSTEPVRPVRVDPNAEDDGAIPLARDLKLGDDRRGISTTGRSGDGPHGSSGGGTGDYDFYRLRASAGDTLTVDVAPDGALVPNALLYDAEGNLLVGAQDMTGNGEVHLSHPIERDGEYFVAVGNYIPSDPFDPASGLGVITEGPYQLDLTLHADAMADTDLYAIPLRKGDVLGATVSGAARRIAIHALDGELMQASAADSGTIYPKTSPLPRGGNATGNHVVQETGLYLVAVSDGSGAYSLTLGAHRAPSAGEVRPQTVLLDFSGPTFDNRVLGGSVVEPGIRDISPMRDFLPRWGLTKADERAVIEATTERVREILREDIEGSRVRVTTSVEHPDLFGKPGVSRVIVGGTVKEAGVLPSFGVSESVDPGNFAREETAIVMPERMSGDDQELSLNQFMTEDSDRIRAVSQAVGNTVGHEIGHFLGNFHTDDHAEHTSVMNTGNRLHFFAIGPDGVAGTEDDDRIAMRTSGYDPLQAILGVEDTPFRTWIALR